MVYSQLVETNLFWIGLVEMVCNLFHLFTWHSSILGRVSSTESPDQPKSGCRQARNFTKASVQLPANQYQLHTSNQKHC